MSEILPKWVFKIYANLWKEFKAEEFGREAASRILKENENVINMAFSRLRKSDWLNVRLDPEDNRRRIYELNEPAEIVENIE